MSCYNCGFHAQGIIFQYGRLRYILNRYKPKLIVYDVEYHFDLGKGDNERYLDMLKPYCSDTCVSNYFKDFSYTEYVKNYSRLYRYNTNIFDLLKDYSANGVASVNGFEARKGTMDYEVERKDIPPVEVDSVKIAYLKKFIQSCKQHQIPLVMFVSPRYDASSSIVHEPIKKMCKDEDVPFYDFFTDSCYQNHKELFADSKHLNEVGAPYYTRNIVPFVRMVLNK